MRGLLADVNVEAHVQALLAVLRSATWRSIWGELGVEVFEFAQLKLSRTTLDIDIWQFCQREQLVLITGNRNLDGENSLESAIRQLGEVDSLPVVTIADMDRLLKDREYCDRAAERLLDILLDVDRYRGTGRLFIPRTT